MIIYRFRRKFEKLIFNFELKKRLRNEREKKYCHARFLGRFFLHVTGLFHALSIQEQEAVDEKFHLLKSDRFRDASSDRRHSFLHTCLCIKVEGSFLDRAFIDPETFI